MLLISIGLLLTFLQHSVIGWLIGWPLTLFVDVDIHWTLWPSRFSLHYRTSELLWPSLWPLWFRVDLWSWYPWLQLNLDLSTSLSYFTHLILITLFLLSDLKLWHSNVLSDIDFTFIHHPRPLLSLFDLYDFWTAITITLTCGLRLTSVSFSCWLFVFQLRLVCSSANWLTINLKLKILMSRYLYLSFKMLNCVSFQFLSVTLFLYCISVIFCHRLWHFVFPGIFLYFSSFCKSQKSFLAQQIWATVFCLLKKYRQSLSENEKVKKML